MTKLLKRIDPVRMVGDQIHNEFIDLLYKDVDKRTKTYKNVNNILHEYLKDSSQRWVSNVLNKTDIKRLNALMKSKTNKTYQKRLFKLIDHLAYSSRYGYVFNKELVDLLEMELNKNENKNGLLMRS